MKILFLDAYFAPEKIAFTHLENDLIDGIIADGNEIDVICPTPTRGIDKETADRYKRIRHEELHGGRVRIHRFFAPQEGKNPIIRAARYLWCNLRTYQMGKGFSGTDLIFCASTPPTQGWLAGKLKKKLNCPFVYSLQDVFPDSLVSAGMTKVNSILWKAGRRVEDRTYARCDLIIVLTCAMKRNLIEKGVSEKKIHVISNWIDSDAVKPVPRQLNPLTSKYGIDPAKFIVVYAGNFGAMQGAEIVIQAAERLRDEKEIQFVIFGGGSGYALAKATTEKLALDNVLIHLLLPQERVPEVYSLGDVALITCKSGAGKGGMPSKLWSIMACNTPVIASYDADSELAAVLRSAEAGVCIQPEDAGILAETILHFAQNRGRYSRTRMREYVTQNASKKENVGRYIAVMKESVAQEESRRSPATDQEELRKI